MAFILCEDDDYVEAAQFYASKLNIPSDTIIAIGLYKELDVAGYCIFREDSTMPYYMIGLDVGCEDEDGEDPISVLAHEMVHVKQYVTGELVDKGKHCLWKGKKFEEFEADSEQYFFSPWEVEAFGMQVGLYRLYYRSIEQ